MHLRSKCFVLELLQSMRQAEGSSLLEFSATPDIDISSVLLYGILPASLPLHSQIGRRRERP